MSWFEQFIQKLEAGAASTLLALVKNDATALEAERAPLVTAGETDVVALANKVSPVLGAIVQSAVNALGSDVPKFEGNAVAWIEAVLEAFIAKVG